MEPLSPIHEYFLRAGEAAESTAVVASGLIREFFVMAGGEERTKAFVQRGEATGSLADLLASRASLSNIVAETPARLIVMAFSGSRILWDAVRPAFVNADPTFRGDDAGFCEAYGANDYAPDL